MSEGGDSILCTNCKREISSQNADLHLLHCKRNIKLCDLCDEPVPKCQFQDHMDSEHQEVECKKCKVKFCQGEEDIHERECTMKDITCDYCELPFPRKDIATHLDHCGARTDTCSQCQERVMLKELLGHVCRTRPVSPYSLQPTNIQTHTPTNTTVDFSSHNFFESDTGSRDYLEELISANIDITNGSTVDLDGALAAQLSHDLRKQEDSGQIFSDDVSPTRECRTSQRSRGSDELIPCEFCDTMVSLDDLILHQTGCVDNHIPATRHPGQYGFREELLDFEEEESYIPCEFCCKLFPMSVITQHQAGCTPVRRPPPAFSQILDDRPIRPARTLTNTSAPTNRTARAPARRVTRPSNSQNNMVPQELAIKSRTSSLSRPGPKMGSSSQGPLKVKNSRKTMNDLDKVSNMSHKPPSIVLPKRSASQRLPPQRSNNNIPSKNKHSRSNQLSNGEHSSSTDDGVYQGASRPRNSVISNGLVGSATNILNTNDLSSTNNLGRNNLTGKKNMCSKDVNIDLRTPPRNRQNVLNKYKRNKTFVVSKSDDK